MDINDLKKETAEHTIMDHIRKAMTRHQEHDTLIGDEISAFWGRLKHESKAVS